jgi:hypothetical protein
MPGESGEPEAGGDLLMTMRGVLALLAADRDDRVDDRKPKRSELVLADAGFKAREIATTYGQAIRGDQKLSTPRKGEGGKVKQVQVR